MIGTPLARAVLGMLYFTLVMASYYLLKPIREALFLETQGVYSFPVVHLWNCLATLLAAQAYDLAARRWRPGRLAIWSGPWLAAQILGFALVMQHGWFAGVLPWLYYVWVSVFSVFAPTLLWTLVNNAFTTPEGEKYFGLVAAGGILGGMAGSYLTHQLAGWERAGVLLVAAAILAPVCLLAIPLDRARLPEKVGLKQAEPGHSAWGLLRDRYLAGIAALMFLIMLGAEFADHQTQLLLADAGLKGSALTRWYGSMYGLTNALGLVLNLLFSRVLLKRFGPAPGLLALQLAVICKALAITCWPRPDALMYALSLDLGIHYSLFQASKEVLYLPNHPEVKYRAKTLIDTFFFRFGIGLGAILVLFPLRQLNLPGLSLCVLATSLACLALCLWLGREFEERVRQGSFRRVA
ncbi:MAG: hypothetical protein U0931_36735 [Vulcanimicrobiota bacterium]